MTRYLIALARQGAAVAATLAATALPLFAQAPDGAAIFQRECLQTIEPWVVFRSTERSQVAVLIFGIAMMNDGPAAAGGEPGDELRGLLPEDLDETVDLAKGRAKVAFLEQAGLKGTQWLDKGRALPLIEALAQCGFVEPEVGQDVLHPAVAAAHEAINKVPADAAVSAYHTLTAHMARRERIYVFPVPYRRVLYGPNVFAKGDRLEFANEVQYVILPRKLEGEAAIDWQNEQFFFDVVFGNDYWTVYERVR